MSSVNPAQGIELLHGQIERARALLSNRPNVENSHAQWENTTRAFLVKCFDKGSDEVTEFLEKSRLYMTLDDYEAHYAANLTAQISHLESCIEILLSETNQPSATATTSVKSSEALTSDPSDPLKRRYQVFVSSTYEDLKDERRHTMQALLETKCIPTGMELFPAASEEQWSLIQRIIGDCDYYVVVVAERYGSLGPNGKSFTEMEFDHAVSKGAYVMAFYHSEIDALPFGKVERSENGQRRLVEFTAKLKNARLCKAWTTAEGLASAIKSAILYAIEHHSKPGWVRAKDLAPPAAIAKLRASVSDRSLSSGDQTIELPASIGYNEVDDPNQGYQWSTRKSLSHTLRRTLNQIFLVIAPRLNERKNRRALKIIFENQLAPGVEALVPKKPRKYLLNCECSVDPTAFERVLDTFVAERLFRVVPPPKDVRTKVSYWEITAKGRQRLAELRARSD